MQIPNCSVLQGGKVLFWSWVPYSLLPEILVDCGRRKTSTPHPQLQQAGHWQCCDCLGRVHQEIVAFCFPKWGSCLNWSYKIVTGDWLSGLCVYKCRETLAHLSFHISPCIDNSLCKGRKRHMRFIDWDHKWISRSSSYPGQAYMPFVIDSAHFIEVPFPGETNFLGQESLHIFGLCWSVESSLFLLALHQENSKGCWFLLSGLSISSSGGGLASLSQLIKEVRKVR